jgi:hypothetical protein
MLVKILLPCACYHGTDVLLQLYIYLSIQCYIYKLCVLQWLVQMELLLGLVALLFYCVLCTGHECYGQSLSHYTQNCI